VTTSILTESPPRASFTLTVDRLQLLGIVAAYRLFMDYSYVKYLVPFADLRDNMPNFSSTEKLVESWILMLISALFLPTYFRKPSDFMLTVLFFLPYIAQISLYNFLDGDRLFAYLTFTSFILVALVRNSPWSLPKVQVGQGRTWALIISLAVTLLLASAYYVQIGLGRFQLNLLEVYGVRGEINQQIAQSTLLAYGGAWVYQVFNIFMMTWCLNKRRYVGAAFFILLQVYFFGVTSQKAVLFFPALALLPYFFMKGGKAAAWFMMLMIAIVAAGVLEWLVFNTSLWNQVFVRREIWSIGRTDWGYYDFFSRRQLVHMSDSVLRFVFEYPYQLSPQHTMGLFLTRNPLENVDTGFLGTGYMQFGSIGMLVYSLIVGALLWLGDALTVGRVPAWMGAAILIGPFFSLFNDSDLPTSLLTHGLAIALLLLFVYGQLRARGTDREAETVRL
jgi:hypothetical protein